MTVRDLIRLAMKKIGVLGVGDIPTAEELQDGITVLRTMLDGWSTDGFIVQYRQIEEFDLIAGQGSYTIGTGGDFDTSRPIEIEQVTIKETSTNPAFETDPLDILNMAEFAKIGLKSTQGIPDRVFRNGNYPLDTLTFYPVPDQARKAVIYSRKKLIEITNANTVIQLPEGYERAIVHNLAIELAPDYSREVSAAVATIASDSKAAIMRLNGGPQYLETGPILAGVKYFNIYTGGSE